MTEKKFIDLYLSGEATDDDIHDFIDDWHDLDGRDLELHDFLGLTWPEYGTWVEIDELPVPESRQADRWPVRLQGRETIVAHGVKVCERPCAIHWPSGHHMRSWPQHWRGDRGIIERVCDHGTGHPDPDDKSRDRVHGCCGCCIGAGTEVFT